MTTLVKKALPTDVQCLYSIMQSLEVRMASQ
jgi:hypothetical protein